MGNECKKVWKWKNGIIFCFPCWMVLEKSVRMILLPWEPCTKILAWWTAKQCRRSRDESTSISSMCHFPSSNYLFRILKKIHVNGRNTSTLMFPFPSWVPFLPRAQVGQSSLNEIKSSIQRSLSLMKKILDWKFWQQSKSVGILCRITGTIISCTQVFLFYDRSSWKSWSRSFRVTFTYPFL